MSDRRCGATLQVQVQVCRTSGSVCALQVVLSHWMWHRKPIVFDINSNDKKCYAAVSPVDSKGLECASKWVPSNASHAAPVSCRPCSSCCRYAL
jgi:hypothetical protein